MNIPLYSHAKIYFAKKQSIDAAISRVLTSGNLDWGAEVPAFEAEFAAWVGATHAVSVGSGTAAIKAALLAIGVGQGDEVITVPNTDIAGSSAIRFAGARIVWVDVDPATRCMDPDAAAAAITPRTKAIMPVDLYGHPAELNALRKLTNDHGIALVEDACLALGAEVGGRRLGSIADVTCFSFAPTKHLGAYGCGGACTTESDSLMERLTRISAYGQSRTRHSLMFSGGMAPLRHETEGLNERLDELQAAILRVKLPDLEDNLTQRRSQATRYTELLKGSGLDLPSEQGPIRHGWRNYVIECDNRDSIRSQLTKTGIGTNTPYSPPMHLQPVYTDLDHGVGSFPVAERSCARLLGLPIGPHLELQDIDIAADAVLKAI